MSGTLLVPLQVEARVVSAATTAPALRASSDTALDKGVHLHWALPDALVSARTLEIDGRKRVLFPALPDLWLVVRFNPVSSGMVRKPGRLDVEAPDLATPAVATETPAAHIDVATARPGLATPAAAHIDVSAARPSVAAHATRVDAAALHSIATRISDVVAHIDPAGAIKTATPSPIAAVEAAIAAGIFRPVATGRGSRAWIVESRGRRKVDLDSWTPPADYQVNQVLTLAGVIDAGDGIGQPGWGAFPDGRSDFNEAAAAYYPECQNQFGMVDPLDDLGAAGGTVTYCVVGWYRYVENDPIAQAAYPTALLHRWNLEVPGGAAREVIELITPTVADAIAHTGFTPAIKATQTVDATRAQAIGERLKREPVVSEQSARRAALVDRGLTELALAAGAGAVSRSPIARRRSGPEALACHGATLDVQLAGGSVPAPASPKVLVVPSLQKALGEVATLGKVGMGEDDKLALEAKILDADSKLQLLESQQNQNSLPDPALVGLPNDVHALGFQGAPGESTWFAQLRIGPSKIPWMVGRGVGVKTHPVDAMSITEALEKPPAVKGHWPESRKVGGGSGISTHPPGGGVVATGPAKPAAPQPPSDAEVAAFTAKVVQAIAAINNPPPASAASPHPVNPSRLHVVDSVTAHEGKTVTPGTPRSPEGASYWVNVSDPVAMKNLLIATRDGVVSMPSASALFEVPGPRWYRPFSPQVVLDGAGRSWRYGFDGRFDVDGLLHCRLSGSTLSGINVAPPDLPVGFKSVPAVGGAQIFGAAAGIAGHAGIPSLARSLLEETALLDADNAGDLARQWLQHYRGLNPGVAVPALANLENLFRQAIRGNWAMRDDSVDPDKRDTIESAIFYQGTMPSPIAFIPWQAQPWAPLYANIHYSFQVQSPGALDTVELATGDTKVGAPIAASERRYLTPTVTRVLESAMLTKRVANPRGKLILANGANNQLAPDTFLKMDVLTAPLTDFDDTVFASGQRLRGGTLTVDSIQVVDAFGSTKTYSGSWSATLNERIPDWARLQFRFMSATQSEKEADLDSSPVCGYLVPDLLEHTLEVYDGSGTPLGQLVSEPPVVIGWNDPAAASVPVPAVQFEAHPLRTFTGDPINVIADPRLKEFVEGVRRAARTEASVAPPAPRPGRPTPSTRLRESALTALLRVVDTVRAAVNPTDKIGDHKVRMLGAPIAVVRSRMWLERTTGTVPVAAPDLLGDSIQVAAKVGAVLQQDDGVLGCFISATAGDGSNAHFRPVDKAAVESAILNGLEEATARVGNLVVAHTFVRDPAGADSTFTLTGQTPQDLLLLLDIKGGVFLTSGALPRKKLTLPREFLEPAIGKLAPTFRVGPVLSYPANGQSNPFLPAPALVGYKAQWIEESSAQAAEPLSPLPPDGVVPADRVSVTEGWVTFMPTPDT